MILSPEVGKFQAIIQTSFDQISDYGFVSPIRCSGRRLQFRTLFMGRESQLEASVCIKLSHPLCFELSCSNSFSCCRLLMQRQPLSNMILRNILGNSVKTISSMFPTILGNKWFSIDPFLLNKVEQILILLCTLTSCTFSFLFLVLFVLGPNLVVLRSYSW